MLSATVRSPTVEYVMILFKRVNTSTHQHSGSEEFEESTQMQLESIKQIVIQIIEDVLYLFLKCTGWIQHADDWVQHQNLLL